MPLPISPDVKTVTQIERFTPHSIIFDDNTTLTHIDTIMLATGYEYRIPYLTAGGHLTVTRPSSVIADNTTTLRTNLHYIWPLWRHVLSLDPTYPLGSLYFVNLGYPAVSTFCSVAHGLFIMHTILKPELLDSREAFFADLEVQEARYRAKGYDPKHSGHRVDFDQGVNAYQNGIVKYLQDRGLGGLPEIPPAGQNFTPEWRDLASDRVLTWKLGWDRLEKAGDIVIQQWLDGVETEEQWAELLVRLLKWEKKMEKEEGTRDPIEEVYLF